MLDAGVKIGLWDEDGFVLGNKGRSVRVDFLECKLLLFCWDGQNLALLGGAG